MKPCILSSTFHFPEIMLNIITSSVSDSLAMCPEYKVVASDAESEGGVRSAGGKGVGRSFKAMLLFGVPMYAILLFTCVGCAGEEPERLEAETTVVEAPSEPVPGYNRLRDSLIVDPRIPSIVRYYMTDGHTFVLLDHLHREEDYLVTMPFGDINGDDVIDSVLIMPEGYQLDSVSWVEGESFVFADRRFGKLRSPESGCNHVSNMFVMDDIDEDGLNEIGIYTSSCVGRFKALRVFSLGPDTVWREQGSVTFDIHCPDPPKEQRVRKRDKAKFEFLRVECEKAEGQITLQAWEVHTMMAK